MQLEAFLTHSKYFSLGHLPTEGFHPETLSLSEWAAHDLPLAIQTLQKVDEEALDIVKNELALIRILSEKIDETLKAGGRIFLSGCGATGRLALALESLWRKNHSGHPHENRIQGMIAGGDFALVKSVENFEDFPEYGERHLRDLNFQDGDLLIAISEGGETPYVLGTLEGALQTSSRSPWFVYCNPREVLCQTIERSRTLIENHRVHSLCLSVGPMALSGSTRLQAASAQMLAVGMALFKNFEIAENLIREYSALDLVSLLSPAVEWESGAYSNGDVILYQSEAFPIAVLTDTTERSPTFSLSPFEKSNDFHPPFSLCSLSVPNTQTALQAWKKILGRDPIGLHWTDISKKLDLDSILEFDFSQHSVSVRAQKVSPRTQHILKLELNPLHDELRLQSDSFDLRLKSALWSDPIGAELLIKLILNTHSLLVMGRLKRYEGNVMTWVRPNNGKLIDRTCRYLDFLIAKRGLNPVPKERLVEMIFDLKPKLKSDESIIHTILDQLK